jgi:uncharacterized protein (DUF58 family)
MASVWATFSGESKSEQIERPTAGPALDAKTLSELKKLQFRTRRLANEVTSGAYRSAFRGLGIEFEEVREYTPGDDIRAIDWKVTARTGVPHIKRYREERELHIMVAIDLSASTLGGTGNKNRASVIAQVGAVLTFIALLNNDKVGLLSFTDRVHTFSPPRKSRSAVWKVLHQVMQAREGREGTNLGVACEYLQRVLSRRTVIFLISDFIAPSCEKELVRLNKKHDVVAVRVHDKSDETLPDAGIVSYLEPESGAITLVDTSDPGTRQWFEAKARAQRNSLVSMLRRNSIDSISLATDTPFMPAIRRFLEQHSARRRAAG